MLSAGRDFTIRNLYLFCVKILGQRPEGFEPGTVHLDVSRYKILRLLNHCTIAALIVGREADKGIVSGVMGVLAYRLGGGRGWGGL